MPLACSQPDNPVYVYFTLADETIQQTLICKIDENHAIKRLKNL